MMGDRTVAQEALFYSFNLERHVPAERRLCEGVHLTTWAIAGSVGAELTSMAIWPLLGWTPSLALVQRTAASRNRGLQNPTGCKEVEWTIRTWSSRNRLRPRVEQPATQAD